MLGKYTVGKKALKFGYKRFGIPGAVASGGAALLGYLAVKRALNSRVRGGNAESAIDPDAVKRVVDEKGVGAVTDPGTLDEVVDEDRLDTDVDLDEVSDDAESEAENLRDEADDATEGTDGTEGVDGTEGTDGDVSSGN
ncbi:hypothetical protein ACFO0N_11495 [Halobium salinum]|uniref:Uncharacterized protein n=1 Tax=Halobium salinum TaxID=1364940 RepID=A0ABD5PCG1_9EURY|nr:hypothetical protein [Halobium salinum]